MTTHLDPDAAAFLPQDLWVDLGSGPVPEPGFFGLDLEGTTDRVNRLAPGDVLRCHLWDGHPWPLPQSSAKHLRASHVIQFIPHGLVEIGVELAERMTTPDPRAREAGKKRSFSQQPFVLTQDAFFWFFDQAWRIAQPGCYFELTWPEPEPGPLRDPTVRRQVPLTTLQYLSRDGRRRLKATEYRVGCDWQVERAQILVTREIVAVLRKPERAPDPAGEPADAAPPTPRVGSPNGTLPSVAPDDYEDVE